MHRYRTFFTEKWTYLVILCLLGCGAWFRLTFYGPLHLSIGMVDTPSFISSSTTPTFSVSMFTSRRLFTTNLLFKLAGDPLYCKLENIGVPTDGIELERTRQSCFDKIVLLQNILSVISWSFLALITSRWLKHPINKILAVILILSFGYTPQIAEWDSVLSSESLSLSVFALFFGFLQEVVFQVGSVRKNQSVLFISFLLTSLTVVFVLWVFVRDVHLYSILITMALLVPFLFASSHGNRIGYSILHSWLTSYILTGKCLGAQQYALATTTRACAWWIHFSVSCTGRFFHK
jgi:hypothetical protein